MNFNVGRFVLIIGKVCFRSVPCLRRYFNSMTLPKDSTYPCLTRTIPCRLSNFCVTMTRCVQVISCMCMFPRLINASKNIQRRSNLLLLSMKRNSTSMRTTFRRSFEIIRANTSIRDSNIRICIKQGVIRLYKVDRRFIFARTSARLPKSAISLLRRRKRPLIIYRVRMNMRVIIFMSNYRYSKLRTTTCVTSNVRRIATCNTIRKDASNTMTRVNTYYIRNYFHVTRYDLQDYRIKLYLRRLCATCDVTFRNFLRAYMIILNMFRINTNDIRFYFYLPRVILVSYQFSSGGCLSLTCPTTKDMDSNLWNSTSSTCRICNLFEDRMTQVFFHRHGILRYQANRTCLKGKRHLYHFFPSPTSHYRR